MKFGETLDRGGKAMRKCKILLVDDEKNILAVTAFVLEHGGYQVTTASSAEVAIEALSIKNFDLVITEINMPKTNGIAVLKKVKELHSGCGVMILTANADTSFATEALRLGADDCMLKPWKLAELRRRVANCLQRSEDRQMDAGEERHVWGQTNSSAHKEVRMFGESPSYVHSSV